MAQPEEALQSRVGLMWAAAAYDPDSDGDDDSTPEGDTDHDDWSTDGEPMAAQQERFTHQAASSLPQLQQVTDPNNGPAPEDDQLPEGVAFPIGEGFAAQWVTTPEGAQPKAAPKTAAAADMDPGMAEAMAHADVSNNKVRHQDDFGGNKIQHGRYMRTWNNLAGLMHGLTGRAAISQKEYADQTGRPDLHQHYLTSYAQGRRQETTQATASLYREADAWSQPRKTTNDFDPPFNSPQTTPDPDSANASPESGDYAAGQSAGQSDRQAGERPLFADNSSGVSPYVKGYAQGYGASQDPSGPQDVPRSMGGDSGQAANAGEAQRAFQVARASRTASVQDAWEDARDNLEHQHDVSGGHAVSGAPGSEHLDGEGTGGRAGANWRVSASFAPDALMGDADFRKGYLFAARWRRGQRLAGRGSAQFEAGLYAGITDNPDGQADWFVAHASRTGRHPDLGRRMALNLSFTRKHAAQRGLRVTSHWIRREGGTMTDLITDGPGTSPDPMGSTPLNGPGAPPPMGGLSDPAKAGGAPPYQGAAPLPGGPVVPDDAMGQPQERPQPDGPFVQTFSGTHPENASLAPTAPNKADQSGYTNQTAYKGDPRGNDRLAAFRRRVQAGLAQMEEF
jgi:hypothetical protein